MQVPRVRCLLCILVFMAIFNAVAEAINCSAIKVPDVDMTFFEDYEMEASWVDTFANSSNVTACVTGQSSVSIPLCPKTKQYKVEEKGSLKTCKIELVPSGETVTLFFHDLKCPEKRVKKSHTASIAGMKMRPVIDLSLTYDSNTLSAKWDHSKENYMDLCYNCTAYEISESGQRKEIKNAHGQAEDISAKVFLSTGRHAYKLFEFCVKARYCKDPYVGLWSDEKCAKARSPPERPSEGLKMLCGSKPLNGCEITKDKTKRNVTLIWELPEKSSWNGRAEKIVIVYKIVGKEENDSRSITINGTRTNYTLCGLKLDVRYQITLTFYSNGGEGPDTIYVLQASEVSQPSETPKTGTEINPTVLIIIITATLVLIVAAVVVFTYLICRLKRKHKLSSLPHIQLPVQIPAHSGTDPNIRTNPGDYNILITSGETDIQPNIQDKSSYEKLSCNGSSSSESTNDSVTCPLVSHATKQGHNDVTYYPEQTGDEHGSLTTSGERTTDI